jgi:hypothetical protein
MNLPNWFTENKGKRLIQELHEIEDSLISDDKLKSVIIQSGSQLRKVFGDSGYYDEYMKWLETKSGMTQENILKNMVNTTTNKTKISSTKAITNGETIDVIKNTLLSDYLSKNNLISKKELKNIQNIFKEEEKIIESPLEVQILNQEKIDTLERYVGYISKNKDFLKQNIEDIVNNFENPYSLNSVLGHELAHHIFRKFTKLQSKYFVALNEWYSFAIQKFSHLFDKKEITDQDIKEWIIWLYKIVWSINTSYQQNHYKFMRSFILLLWWLTIASAIEKSQSPDIDTTIINESYNQKTYSWLFELYDKSLEEIKDPKIKELLQQLKNTSLNQLQKCKSILIDQATDDIKWFENSNHERFKLWAQMFVHTLDLLNYAWWENIVNALKVAYFKKFFTLLDTRENFDNNTKTAREKLKVLIASNEFKPKEIIELIEKV